MADDDGAPNFNARRLGKYLQIVREQVVELSYAEAAVRLGCSEDWLARVETGFEPPSPDEVERMLTRFQCREARVAGVLIDLASRPAGPAWLAPHVDRIPRAEQDILTMESEASVIRCYCCRLMPPLLQVESYARPVLPYVRLGDVDVDAEWELLRSRQRHHAGSGHRFLKVILDEGVLKHTLLSFPPEVRVEQLRHLLARDDEDPFTTVRVVPLSVPIKEDRIHPFDVLEFPEVNDRVTVAYSFAGVSLSQVDATPTLDHIEADLVLSADEGRDLIGHYLSEYMAEAAGNYY